MKVVVERSIDSKLGCNYHTTAKFYKCLNMLELNIPRIKELIIPKKNRHLEGAYLNE
jgi:hypothetical protein